MAGVEKAERSELGSALGCLQAAIDALPAELGRVLLPVLKKANEALKV